MPERTVSCTFTQEQLKAYDENGAQTYILDAGDYYITAAANAHAAINQILTAKGADTNALQTVGGLSAAELTTGADADLVTIYTPDIEDTDTTTYAVDSYSGAEITNQLQDCKADVTYLTRSDWTGTFPTHDGEPGSHIQDGMRLTTKVMYVVDIVCGLLILLIAYRIFRTFKPSARQLARQAAKAQRRAEMAQKRMAGSSS